MTQTREKLSRDKIKNQRRAISIYEDIGKEVPEAISNVSITLPKNIQLGKNIKNAEKRLKPSTPKMDL